MWVAKTLRVIENEGRIEELEIISFTESRSLRNVYEIVLWECKDERCAFAAIYKDMTVSDVFEDDPTKNETKAVYQISKGVLGGVLLWGRNHDKRLLQIRENNMV